MVRSIPLFFSYRNYQLYIIFIFIVVMWFSDISAAAVVEASNCDPNQICTTGEDCPASMHVCVHNKCCTSLLQTSLPGASYHKP